MKRIRLSIWLLSILFVFSALPAFSEGTLTLPASLKKIGNRAFEGDDSFTKISFGSAVTSVGQYAFSNCDGLNELVVPSHIGTINAYAFQDCDDLRIVTIESGVNTIGNHAFYGCDSLSALTLNQGIDTIGSYAFSECDGLTELTLGSDIGTIDEYAFSNCDGLETLTIGSDIGTIGNNAFSDCDLLNKVTFWGEVNSLSPTAFSACSTLTSLVFNAGEVNYSNVPFPPTVKSITFEKDVDTVYASSFNNCTAIERLVFNGPRTTIIGDFSFIQTDKVTVIAPFAGDALAFIDGEHFVRPEYRALLIGQEYNGAKDEAGKDATLHGCIEDAESLARMLYTGKNPSLNAEQIVDYHIVVDESAENKSVWTEDVSALDIPDLIQKVLTAKSDDDVSLFYFSGHGTTNQTGSNSYLVGKNGDRLDYISGAQLRAALDKIPGKKIVIIDACYSGGLIGRGISETDASFAESFISSFSLSSRNGELASDDYFVIVSASVMEGNKLSVSIKEGPAENLIYYGLFTRFFAEAFGWNRIVSSASGYGDWEKYNSLELPADAGSSKDGCVTLKEAYIYTDRKVEGFKINWNQSHTAEKDKIYQVTKVWPYADVDGWPDIANIVLFGWTQNPPEGGE